jgi:hypothetical protein
MPAADDPALLNDADARLTAAVPLAVRVLRAWARDLPAVDDADPASGPGAATLLAQNRLLGLAGDVLSRSVSDPIVDEAIQGFRRLTAEMNGAGLILMRRLMTTLATVPEKVVVYKGVVLQQHLYGTPFARPSSDIDLLTSPSGYAIVARHLQNSGYHLDPHTDTLWWRWFLAEQQFRADAGAQNIDLHHRLQQPGCPMPRKAERLTAQATPVAFLGGQVLTFRDDHALIVAAISVAKALHHREPAGRYVGDAERFLRRLTPEGWAAVAKEADEMGLGRTLDLTVRCVDAVFATVPSSQRRAILPEVSDFDLQQMVLAPGQARWIRRRRLLRALCDSPADALSAWLIMAASETARIISGPAKPGEATH